MSTTPTDEREEPRVVGNLTRTQAARALVLLAAFLSFVFSVSLWFSGSEDEGVFVGIWVPTILSLGAFLIPRRAS